MGNWVIHIEGHGIHDNGVENDADALARGFADQLKAAGHHVAAVSFTSGATKVLPVAADGTGVHSAVSYIPGDDRHMAYHINVDTSVASGAAPTQIHGVQL